MVVQDLFTSKQQLFWEWCQRKQLFSSVDISRYGLANYYLRANRTVRSWCEGEHPKLRRLDTKEKLFRGLIQNGNKMVGWYEIVTTKYKEVI